MRTEHPKRRLALWKLAVLVPLSMAAAGAQAQTGPDTGLDKLDSRLDRIEPPDRVVYRGEEAEKANPWELSLSLPFSYNSNVANADTNPDQAFHVDPTITLGKTWSLGGGELFFEANADSDAYTEHSENDNSTLTAQLGYRFGDATTGVSPYLHYTIVGLFDGQFENHSVTAHVFTVGAKRIWSLDPKNKLVADANLLRREATVVGVEQNRGTINMTFVHVPNDRTKWSFGARGQYARYTGGASDGREDVTLRLLGGVSYELSDSATLDVQATFQRNWSDRAGKDYSVWDVGPSLTLTTSF